MHSILEQCYNQFYQIFLNLGCQMAKMKMYCLIKISNRQFFEVCFIQLSKSIISGEYIGTPNFIDVLNRFWKNSSGGICSFGIKKQKSRQVAVKL